MAQANLSSEDTNPTFEALLDHLRRCHGFNFSGYKRSSIMRRVQQRLQMLQIPSYNDYGEYLRANPEEFSHIFINFTSFFRDASAWDHVAESLVPRIIAGKSQSEPIRVWSAGCASGQETYTLAIILAQAVGMEQFRSRVRIYGTDVDQDALNQARLGSYVSNQLEGIPSQFIQYFKQVKHHYIFREDLRRSIIFGHHDLLQDAPMAQIDLLVCRNVLIYLNSEAQNRVLVRFHFGLQNKGFLLLGKAETVPSETSNIFSPVNLHNHIFTKLPRANLNSYLLTKALLR